MNEDISETEPANTSGRKRSRSETDDLEECLPIAKRINNLQIRSRECSSDGFVQDGASGSTLNNWDADQMANLPKLNGFHQSNAANNCDNNNTMFFRNDQPVAGSSSQAAQELCNQRISTNEVVPEHLKNFIDGFKSDVDMEPYEPELNDLTNPHYYSINQLLYYANFARQTRTKNGFKQ